MVVAPTLRLPSRHKLPILARVIATHLRLDKPSPQPPDQPTEARQSPAIGTPTQPTPATFVLTPETAPVTQPAPTVDHAEQQVDNAQRSFKRTLGPYPLRSRGAALLVLRARKDTPKWGRNTGCAFAA
eukprot:6203060-Pleurochrysis_carterae.AAC.3